MSIASEITRISGNIADAYTSLNAKGATMPATQNSANLADTIDTITTGGGGSQVVRGNWIVPQLYLDIDAETGKTDSAEYLIVKTYAGNEKDVTVIGFTLYNGYYTFSWNVPSSGTEDIDRPPVIKISDGRVFYASYLNQSTDSYSETQTINIDNSSGNICIYFYYIHSKVSTGGGMNTFWTGGSLGKWSKGYYKDIMLSRFMKYFAINGVIVSTANLKPLTCTNAESFNILEGSTIPKYEASTTKMWNANRSQISNINLAKYYPPISEWATSNQISGIGAYTFSNTWGTPIIPDGTDFSNYTDSSTFNIGCESSCENDLWANQNLRAYCTLPATDVRFRRYAILSKDNWEYIAEHAPTVSGKTLTVTQENIDAMGGTSSTAYTTLTGKGWTIA